MCATQRGASAPTWLTVTVTPSVVSAACHACQLETESWRGKSCYPDLNPVCVEANKFCCNPALTCGNGPCCMVVSEPRVSRGPNRLMRGSWRQRSERRLRERRSSLLPRLRLRLLAREPTALQARQVALSRTAVVLLFVSGATDVTRLAAPGPVGTAVGALRAAAAETRLLIRGTTRWFLPGAGAAVLRTAERVVAAGLFLTTTAAGTRLRIERTTDRLLLGAAALLPRRAALFALAAGFFVTAAFAATRLRIGRTTDRPLLGARAGLARMAALLAFAAPLVQRVTALLAALQLELRVAFGGIRLGRAKQGAGAGEDRAKRLAAGTGGNERTDQMIEMGSVQVRPPGERRRSSMAQPTPRVDSAYTPWTMRKSVNIACSIVAIRAANHTRRDRRRGTIAPSLHRSLQRRRRQHRAVGARPRRVAGQRGHLTKRRQTWPRISAPWRWPPQPGRRSSSG